MKRWKITLRLKNSELELRSNDIEELISMVRELPRLTSELDQVVVVTKSASVEFVGIEELVKYDENNMPILSVPDELSDRYVILVLLAAVGDKGLKSGDIGVRMSLSGIVSSGYASRLSEMRREGLLAKKPSGEYFLTERGRRVAQELIARLSSKVIRNEQF